AQARPVCGEQETAMVPPDRAVGQAEHRAYLGEVPAAPLVRQETGLARDLTMVQAAEALQAALCLAVVVPAPAHSPRVGRPRRPVPLGERLAPEQDLGRDRREELASAAELERLSLAPGKLESANRDHARVARLVQLWRAQVKAATAGWVRKLRESHRAELDKS